MASIFVVMGRDRGSYFPVEGQCVVVGRDDGCDIQIIDEMVSRRHLELRREGDEPAHRLEDLGSANGVTVNGHRILRPTLLHDGDVIQIGGSKLLYSLKQISDLDTAMAFLKERGHHDRDTVIP